MRPVLLENYNTASLARVCSRQSRSSPKGKGQASVEAEAPPFADSHFRVVSRGFVVVSRVTEPKQDKWISITRTKEPGDQQNHEFGISYSNKYLDDQFQAQRPASRVEQFVTQTHPFLAQGQQIQPSLEDTPLVETFYRPDTSYLNLNQEYDAGPNSRRHQQVFQHENKTIYDQVRPIDLGQENIQQQNDFFYIPQPVSPRQIVDTTRQKADSGVDYYFDSPKAIEFCNQYQPIGSQKVQSAYQAQNREKQCHRRTIFYQKQSCLGKSDSGPINLVQSYQYQRQAQQHQSSPFTVLNSEFTPAGNSELTPAGSSHDGFVYQAAGIGIQFKNQYSISNRQFENNGFNQVAENQSKVIEQYKNHGEQDYQAESEQLFLQSIQLDRNVSSQAKQKNKSQGNSIDAQSMKSKEEEDNRAECEANSSQSSFVATEQIQEKVKYSNQINYQTDNIQEVGPVQQNIQPALNQANSDIRAVFAINDLSSKPSSQIVGENNLEDCSNNYTKAETEKEYEKEKTTDLFQRKKDWPSKYVQSQIQTIRKINTGSKLNNRKDWPSKYDVGQTQITGKTVIGRTFNNIKDWPSKYNGAVSVSQSLQKKDLAKTEKDKVNKLNPTIKKYSQQKPNSAFPQAESKVVNYRSHNELVRQLVNIRVIDQQLFAVETGISIGQPILNSQKVLDHLKQAVETVIASKSQSSQNTVDYHKIAVQIGMASGDQPSIDPTSQSPLQTASEEGRNLLEQWNKESECDIDIDLPVEQVRLSNLIAEARTKISQARRSVRLSQVQRETYEPDQAECLVGGSNFVRPAGLREWREGSEGRREERGWAFGEKIAKNIVRLRESQY